MFSTRIYTNLPSINQEITREFFETYFKTKTTITENDLSAIVSYFEGRADNTLAANALALAVLISSVEKNIPPMEILDRFKKYSKQQIDAYLATFINFSRIPTSLLGISNLPRTSQYVDRQILL